MTILLTGFILFVLLDAILSAAVIYHLRQYTMPGWTIARAAIALYLILATIFLGIAIYQFRKIDPDDLADFIRDNLALPGGLRVR